MSPNSITSVLVENTDNMFDIENNRNKKLCMFGNDEMRGDTLERW